MRSLILIGLLLPILVWKSMAQSGYLPLHRGLMLFYEEKADSLHGFHASVRPYLSSDVVIDSALKSIGLKIRRSANNTENQNSGLSARPLVYGMYGAGTDHVFLTAAGFEFQIQPGKKFCLNVRYMLNSERFPNQYNTLLDSGFIPHYGQYTAKTQNGTYSFQDVTGYVSWSPLHSLNFQAGKDRNFWGYGYRSLFLSDNSDSYPFFKTTFTAWKIKYVSLLAFFRDVKLPGKANILYPKFGAFHYLSWNASSILNLSFFESVTFRGTDSAQYRGFDFQYVNPVTFYRPVEYSIGSPDKMNLGLGASLKFFKYYQLYGQFLLGEFILKEFVGGKGWWGNKYGIQAGIKSQDAFGIQGLHILVEGNMVRPYTYAHDNTLSNFGQMMQPLAHPFGANFMEALLEAMYVNKRNVFGINFFYSVSGLDSANLNYGQDIYKNYTTRISDYGIKMLQGVKSYYTAADIRYTYLLLPAWDMVVEAGYMGAFRKTMRHGSLEGYFYVSIKTLLNNDESFRH